MRRIFKAQTQTRAQGISSKAWGKRLSLRKYQSQTTGEDEDQAQPFQAGAGLSDDDHEARGADAESCGVDEDVGDKEAQDGVDGVESDVLEEAAGDRGRRVPTWTGKGSAGTRRVLRRLRRRARGGGFRGRSRPRARTGMQAKTRKATPERVRLVQTMWAGVECRSWARKVWSASRLPT